MLKPGSKVEVSGLRNGVPFHVMVNVIQRPPQIPVMGSQGNTGNYIEG
jgi:serine protease DegS/serine protease DegQ